MSFNLFFCIAKVSSHPLRPLFVEKSSPSIFTRSSSSLAQAFTKTTHKSLKNSFIKYGKQFFAVLINLVFFAIFLFAFGNFVFIVTAPFSCYVLTEYNQVLVRQVKKLLY